MNASYQFGETPSEVIRERYATLVAPRLLPLTLRGWSPDNLLTVLDALRDQYKFSADYGHRAKQLRIDILAALGIEES